MNKQEIIDGIKRKGSHGNIVNKETKAQESQDIEAQTKVFLKKNKITEVSSYDER